MVCNSKEPTIAHLETRTCQKLHSNLISYRSQTVWVSNFKYLTPNEDHRFFHNAQVTFLTPTIQYSHTRAVFKIWQKFLDDGFGAIEIPIQ